MSSQQASARILFVAFVLSWMAFFIYLFWGPNALAWLVNFIVIGSFWLCFWLFKKGWIDE